VLLGRAMLLPYFSVPWVKIAQEQNTEIEFKFALILRIIVNEMFFSSSSPYEQTKER
jgi:hypothetical protein